MVNFLTAHEEDQLTVIFLSASKRMALSADSAILQFHLIDRIKALYLKDQTLALCLKNQAVRSIRDINGSAIKDFATKNFLS